MKLIDTLASGVNGATGGTVDVYSRGTPTRAKIYSNFIGSIVNTPTASLPLDGNGGTSIYVNEYVDCVVKDASGNIIRSFTAGEASTDVECNSQSFTGADYVTGLTGASKPVSLAVILDAWKTSAGALDWNVIQGGSSRTIQAAIAGLTGLFYNVKDATYGAVGDGIIDDTSAIQSALTAAATKGGIVFFPGGLYRITAALTVPANVSLMGIGAADQVSGGNGSIISMDHASNNALTYGSASTTTQIISGLNIRPKQGNSGALIKITNVVRLRIDACYIGSSLVTPGGNCILCNTTDGAKVLATGCTFETGGGATRHVLMTLGYIAVYGCTFVLASGAYAGVCIDGEKGVVVRDCYFENSTVTSGAFQNVQAQTGAGKQSIISGNFFPNPTGGTCTAWASTTDLFQESNNFYGSAVVVSPPNATGAQANRNGFQYLSRPTMCSWVASDAGSVTVDAGTYGMARIVRSTSANQTVVIGGSNTSTTPGQFFTLVYDNSSGGNITTVTLTTCANLATFTGPNSGTVVAMTFVAIEENSKVVWMQIAGAGVLPGAANR